MHHGWVRQFAAVLLAVVIGWCSAVQFSVRTPEGVQCRTAAVQTLSAPILSKCGHIIGFEDRKPKPGEKGFVQCRCAEKQSSQQSAVTPVSSHTDMLPPSLASLTQPLPLPENHTEHPYLLRKATYAPAPPTLPPAA